MSRVFVLENERKILGFCAERGYLPALVTGVPDEAWSGPARMILEILILWELIGYEWGPLDLWQAHGRIDALKAYFSATDLLLLPQHATYTEGEANALCEGLAAKHEAKLGYIAAIQAAEARAEETRLEAMRGAYAAILREREPTRIAKVHPGWERYMKISSDSR